MNRRRFLTLALTPLVAPGPAGVATTCGPANVQ
jgi:hypothetical protein